MPRLCSVCTHKQHAAIDAALIEHSVPYGGIAAAYAVSETALYHHKVNHLRQRLEDARMLDAQALARRMQQLDGHVDRILESAAGSDERLTLMAVAEGRRNVDTLMRLLIVHAAEQHDEQRTVSASSRPLIVFANSPDALRKVLQKLIESGAAIPPPRVVEPPGSIGPALRRLIAETWQSQWQQQWQAAVASSRGRVDGGSAAYTTTPAV